jgi:hypothetical protein
VQCIVTYVPGMYLSYLDSVLIYKFLILITHRPDTAYGREQECEDPWLFFEAKRGGGGVREQKIL